MSSISIEGKVNQVIQQAIALRVTDVHICPRRSSYLLQFRKTNELLFDEEIPIDVAERMVNHLKFISALDVSERRIPQSGAIQFSDLNTSLRVSTLPLSLGTESLVIRILSSDDVLHVDNLSIFPESLSILKKLTATPNGLILLTGPTGSGKTTTMYSMMRYCVEELNRHIITIEDPVEKRDERFVQVQVNEAAGITYSTGLKAILRHDPDVIMLGEIRDRDTAMIAIRAGLSGHLVLSTLHAKNTKSAVTRLKEFGIKPLEIEQAIIGITAQRLVKTNSSSVYGAKEKTILYEILSDKNLQEYLVSGKAPELLTLPHHLTNAFTKGFISKEEYLRWTYAE